MKWSWYGRAAMGLLSALALGLGMTACGGGTIAYLWTVATGAANVNGQIYGYQVDDYTGNLTTVQNAPFSTNGENPVYILVKPQGRYVYVLNQGKTVSTKSNTSDAGIAVFSVGGTGTLTYQQSYGNVQGADILWAQFDSSGGFLYVLTKYSPNYQPDPTKPNYDVNGSLTTFSADPNTGRLLLVSQAAQTPSGGTAPTFVEVGNNPLMMASTGTCLFTLNQGGSAINAQAGAGNIPSSITPFSIQGSGQLNVVTTGVINQTYVRPTSINGNNQFMIVTDAGASASGTIYPYTVSGSCGLTSFTSNTTNDLAVSNPVYSYLDTSSKYLFVLNASVNNSNPNSPFSQITGYNIVSNQVTENSNSPFKSGSGPSCMVEDPTAKFMYVANTNDGTITGYDFDSTRGTLSDLQRGSTFSTGNTGLHCLALSASVN